VRNAGNNSFNAIQARITSCALTCGLGLLFAEPVEANADFDKLSPRDKLSEHPKQ
jgi:hypothetical protein